MGSKRLSFPRTGAYFKIQYRPRLSCARPSATSISSSGGRRFFHEPREVKRAAMSSMLSGCELAARMST